MELPTAVDRALRAAGVVAVSHLALAAAVCVHAVLTGRDAERWTLATLIGGLLGIGAYLVTGDAGPDIEPPAFDSKPRD